MKIQPVLSTELSIEEAAELVCAARTHADAVLDAQWQRYAKDERFYYDQAEADTVVVWFPKFIRHSKGDFAGKPFVLEPWQEKAVRIIFGFKWKSNHKRVVRRLFLFIARKNGKSTFCAALAVFMLIADQEPKAEIYSAAADKEQAEAIFEEAKSMIEQMPSLEKRTVIYKTAIHGKKDNSVYRIISSVGKTKHGRNPHCIMFDELHTQDRRELYEALHTGFGARSQPLEVLVSTAGADKRKICGQVYMDAVKVRDGRAEDPTLLPLIFEVPEGEDWREFKNLAKANPSLGAAYQIDELVKLRREALRMPSEQNTFRRLSANQWTTQVEHWIDPPLWAACHGPWDWRELPQLMLGKECIGGMDLASVRDVAGWVKVFEWEDDPDTIILVPRFYIPKDNVQERVDRDGVHYDVWLREGAMIGTEGNEIDYKRIEVDFIEDAQRFKYLEVPYDRFDATATAANLQAEGLPMVKYPQNFMGMSAACKLFENKIVNKKVIHGGHPVLAWMVENTALQHQPGTENVRPCKIRSSEKIDGTVMTLMCIGRYIARRAEPKQATPGIAFIEVR